MRILRIGEAFESQSCVVEIMPRGSVTVYHESLLYTA
ncbi:predicted protein [Botrytis cinerea T4]|uniref:Uncharacterized protein n=1 Tax=Botryotinia fuckeliana (strain T4) TaxID=999810 RepID=G2Y744_BOTF4|nr:predicted protein [Botrytis cinerea T4]